MALPLPILNIPRPVAPPPAPASAGAPGRLFDGQGREISDLRLSVTDRCNYRCVYCMDPDYRYLPKRELLQLDEYVRLATTCVGLGIEKIRITGGEPTLYPQLDELIDVLGRLPIRDLAMTTNGSTLTEARARRWAAAGLTRITLSLDSLRADRVTEITRSNSAAGTVLRAIGIARSAGLEPIKVNAVVMRGVNDDEVADFADFARTNAIDYRLIEFMPLDSSRRWSREHVFSADEMLERIRQRHDLVALNRDDPHSTSLNFGFKDGSPGRIGIIAPVTRVFCGACSRMRITADGKLRPCLFSHEEWDLRPTLRTTQSDLDLQRFIIDAMFTKQPGHGIDAANFRQPERTMSAIGG